MFFRNYVHLYLVKGEHTAQVVVQGVPCTHQTHALLRRSMARGSF